jgi:hypothetical protein
VDCGEKISRSFVVAGGDRPVLFELAEEILDQMSRLVGILVEVALAFAVAPGRDHDRFSSAKQRLDDPFIGIKGLVGQQSVGCHFWQQRVGALQIMGLAWRQQKAQRLAKRIDQRVNLGAQPAFAAPDRFVFARFFWAPALC